jgi:hypothetical protein
MVSYAKRDGCFRSKCLLAILVEIDMWWNLLCPFGCFQKVLL